MMGKISIDLLGADSAHFAKMSRLESRTIDFPDGIRRIVTLPHRFWHAHDIILDDLNGWSDFEHSSYEWTLENYPLGHPEFEDELRRYFKMYIEMSWVQFNETARGNANENR